jgi:phosphohistidine phosphatase
MDLYLIRHADALALGERGITEESERPLSEQGENQARLLGKGMQRRGLAFDKIVTSPYLRARQTTEGLLGAWSTPPEKHVCADLVPDGKPKKAAAFLSKLGGERVALVGHMPQLGEMTAWLIGSRKVHIDLAKAGVAHVVCKSEVEKGAGALIWLVTPEWV